MRIIRRIACPLCAWHRPLKSKSLTSQRDEDGFAKWDPDPNGFHVLRFQEFGGGYKQVSKFKSEATLKEMRDHPDPQVREQYRRIRQQILKLARLVK